jgi:hypothetical protein
MAAPHPRPPQGSATPTAAPVAPPAAPLATAAATPAKRWAPNIPGSLTRALCRRFGVDGLTAMRIALLYGDMEWLAAGATSLRYSASDYARRQAVHRHTVHADLRRLEAIGAIGVSYDHCNGAVLQLHGLGCLGDSNLNLDGPPPTPRRCERQLRRCERQPWRSERQAPCRSEHQPPGDQIDRGLSMGATTLEKGLKIREKKKREEGIKEQESLQASSAHQPQTSTNAAVLRQAQPGDPPSSPHDPAALLAGLLEIFRRAAPSEWPAPRGLTLTPGRRSRLLNALAHAGSVQALERQLQTALEHIPPWFRGTYPTRPDGSRRPSHQFFDLLFRAAAAERDGGPEAWHLFAWSEAALQRPATNDTNPAVDPATEPPGQAAELERARQLFYWDTHHWCGIGIAALELTLAEKRRLTALLEASGYGLAGTAARQYAEPSGAGTDPARALPLWLSGGEPPGVTSLRPRPLVAIAGQP